MKQEQALLQTFLSQHPSIEERLIFWTLTGSRLRGLATEESDYDFILVVFEDVSTYGKIKNKIQEIEFNGNHYKIASLMRYLQLVHYNHYNYIESLFYQEYFDTQALLDAYYNKELFLLRSQHEVDTYRTNKRIDEKKRQVNIERVQAVGHRVLKGEPVRQELFRPVDASIQEGSNPLPIVSDFTKFTRQQLQEQEVIEQWTLAQQIGFNYRQIEHLVR